MDKKKIEKYLDQIKDPELGFGLVELGLIYEIKEIKDGVKIKLTLTSPFCPWGGMIEEQIREKLIANSKQLTANKKKIKVQTEIVFEPVWSPERLTEEMRARLGI